MFRGSCFDRYFRRSVDLKMQVAQYESHQNPTQNLRFTLFSYVGWKYIKRSPPFIPCKTFQKWRDTPQSSHS